MSSVATDTPIATDVVVEPDAPIGKRKRRTPSASDAPARTTPPLFVPQDDAIAINVVMADLVWSPLNPRKTFDETGLAELAESIKTSGLLQPVIVRNNPAFLETREGKAFEGYIGERRYRAHQLLNAVRIRAIVRDVDDATMMRVMAIENLQRADLPPMEEARAYRDLLAADAQLSVVELAARIGKEASYVHRRLVLTNLPDEAQAWLESKQLPFRAALELARAGTDAIAEIVTELRTRHIKNHWRIDVNTIADLVGRSMRVLKRAPFSPKNAELVPAAGACITCPKRTSAMASLFPDLQNDDDRCTDAACWGTKIQAHLERRHAVVKAEAEAAGMPLALLSLSYESKIEGVLTSGEWRNIDDDKKSCPDTALGLVVDGSTHNATFQTGAKMRVCVNMRCKVHGHSHSSSKSGLETKRLERGARAESEVRLAALTAALAKVKLPTAWAVPRETLVDLRVMAAHALDKTYDHERGALCQSLDLEYVQHKEPTIKRDRAVDGHTRYLDKFSGAQAALRKHLDKLSGPELIRFAIYLSLWPDTQTHGSTRPEPEPRLEAFVARHKVDIAAMRTARMAEWRADEKRRDDARIASEKRKKEKAARDAAKAAGQGDVVATAPKRARKKTKAKKKAATTAA